MSWAKPPLCLAAAAVLLAAGCNQLKVDFQHIQLINQTSHNITFYGVGRTEAQARRAANLLEEPLAPNEVATAKMRLPGRFWLRAVADVDGTDVERITGPVHVPQGVRAWAWRENEAGEIIEGTSERFVFAQTDLPALVLDTNEQEIPDEPKIEVTMHLTDADDDGLNEPNGTPLVYDGFAGIERRGNSSQLFDQKAYGLETWDEEGEGIDVELLGMPEEEDWVLATPWMDRSIMRTRLGFGLFNAIGRYAPRTRYVETYLNDFGAGTIEDAYHGVYTLTESIKRDKNRVDIEKLDEEDNDPSVITGGYILEMKPPNQIDPGDRTFEVAGDFVISVEEPDADDVTDEQFAYISGYIGDFEEALFGENFTDPVTGYRAFVDVDALVDYTLLQDFFKNRDAFQSSVFMHKDRDGKLVMGPVWDTDLIFGYFSFYGFGRPEGWFLKEPPHRRVDHSPWVNRLFEDPAFVEQYIDRWRELRQGPLATPAIMEMIDGFQDELKTAHARHFLRWQTLGKTLVPSLEFLMFLGPHPDSWEGEVEYLRNWLSDRGEWMDKNIGGLAK